MSLQSQMDTARNLIARHGSQAAAVAEQNATEARLAGNTTALGHWRSVRVAVDELRSTASKIDSKLLS